MKRTAIAALAALSLGLAACGDDDDKSSSSETKTAAFEMSGSAKTPKVTGPKTVDAGAVKVSLTNNAEGSHGLQLARIDSGHSPAEALKAGSSWGDKGTPLPSWIHLEGGTPDAEPGATQSVVQTLPAGSYLALDNGTDEYTQFEVSGDGGGELPASDGSVTATEYKFDSSGLKAGTNSIEFDNAGKQPHFLVALPIKAGGTFAEVQKGFSSENGSPPVDEKNATSTAILDGGGKQVVSLKLQQGKYALVCFIPDRQGGPPHVAKGMISEADVQ